MERYYLILNYDDYRPPTYAWEVPSVFHNWHSDMLSGGGITKTVTGLFWEFAKDTEFTPTYDMEFLVIEFKTEEEFVQVMNVFDRMDCSTGDLGREDVQLVLRALMNYPKYSVKVCVPPVSKPEPKSFWS